MSPARKRKVRWIIYPAIALGIVLSCAGVFAWSLRGTTVESNDQNRYSELLAGFDQFVCQHIPRSIPADAMNVSMSYKDGGGGIGPGFMRLEAHFTTSSASIAAFADRARATKEIREEHISDSVTEWTMLRGDHVGVLRVDQKTGEVDIRAGIN